MPKTKTKTLTANSGAEVSTVVQNYLESKSISKYIKFNFMGLQRLPGPVQVVIKLKWTTGIGGSANITATGSNNQTVTLQDTTVVIPKTENKKDVEALLENAGLL